MPKSIPRTPIILDPEKWPAYVFRHIFVDQPFAIPAELYAALETWGKQMPSPGAGPDEKWWKDLSPFHKNLKGFALVGKGSMPSGITNPGETFHYGRKLAFDVDAVLDGYQPF